MLMAQLQLCCSLQRQTRIALLSVLLIFFFCYIECSFSNTQRILCELAYGRWSACNDETGRQNRTVNCRCNQQLAPLRLCQFSTTSTDTTLLTSMLSSYTLNAFVSRPCLRFPNDDGDGEEEGEETETEEEVEADAEEEMEAEEDEEEEEEEEQAEVKEKGAKEDEASSELVCKWKWSRWSRCTQPCGAEGGNTTRYQVCVCDGKRQWPENCTALERIENETCSCNQFHCGRIKAKNKIYWMNQDPSTWPLPDGTFDCTHSSSSTPGKGKTYSSILHDIISPPHPTPAAAAGPVEGGGAGSTEGGGSSWEEGLATSSGTTPSPLPALVIWHYLAKEWVAARLNQANGVAFTKEQLQVLNLATDLIDYCSEILENHSFSEILALKEKLGRINNNIGGLNNVDSQIAVALQNEEMTTGGRDASLQTEDEEEEKEEKEEYEEEEVGHYNPETIVLMVAIPLGVMTGIVVGLVLYVYFVVEDDNNLVDLEKNVVTTTTSIISDDAGTSEATTKTNLDQKNDLNEVS